MLLAVKVGGALAEVARFNDGGFLVTLVHTLDDVGVQVLNLLLDRAVALNSTIGLRGVRKTYLFEFILAEKGRAEMLSSIGRLTEGMGMFEIPLSYNRRLRSFFLDLSGTKLLRSI